MNKKFFDIKNNLNVEFNYRYIQPPQIAYFVTTQDEFGNLNSTPVTLGTCISANMPRDGKKAEFYMSFSLGKKVINDKGNQSKPRDGYINLLNSSEVVISYIGKNLLKESIVANMPYPRGISEVDVAGLHTFESKNISVPSILECPINIECKVINKFDLGENYMHYIAEVVGISVDETLIEKDNNGLGVYHIDPLFEVNITKTENKNIRLNYGYMDHSRISVPGDDFGSEGDWVGTFEHFVQSEQNRGKISEEELSEILELKTKFKKDRSNKEVKKRLTDLLIKTIGDSNVAN